MRYFKLKNALNSIGRKVVQNNSEAQVFQVNQYKLLPALSFAACSLMVLHYWNNVLNCFGFFYTDGDQTIMWNALLNYSNNQWHEPRFYGQNYSSMFEALLAVPLYKLGMPANYALPLITTLLCFTPYVLLFIDAIKEKKYLQALIIISLPLLLHKRYALITVMPRGFLPGIFVASLAIFRSHPTLKPSASVRFAFLAILAYSLNPNSLFLLLPYCIERLGAYLKNIVALKYLAAGALLGGFLHFGIRYFYVLHPQIAIHKMVGMEFSFQQIFSQFSHLDKLFNDVCPVFWNAGFLILLILPCLSLILFLQKEKTKGTALLIFTVILVLSLGFDKVTDGSSSVFFPYARFYLAIPIVIGTAVSWLNTKIHFKLWYIALPFAFYLLHLKEAATPLPSGYLKNQIVAYAKVYKFEEICTHINSVAKKNEVKLILVSNNYFRDLVNYGCSSCVENFPITIRTHFERRTWLLADLQNKVFDKVLIFEDKRQLDIEDPMNIQKIDKDFYMLDKNKLSVKDIIARYHL